MYTNRCIWCRARNPSFTIPFQLAHKAQRLYKAHQIQHRLQIENPSGDGWLCAGCGEAVQEAIAAAYLERRKFAPENVEQIEELSERAAMLEAEKQEAQQQNEKRETRLREDLIAVQRELFQKERQLRITNETLHALVALPQRLAAEAEFHEKNAVEAELEDEDGPAQVTSDPDTRDPIIFDDRPYRKG